MEYFRITYKGETYAPSADDTLVVLHRDEGHRDLDYLSFADHEAREMVTVLDAPELARWVAGLAWDGLKWSVPKVRGKRFKEKYGWNPDAIIIRNKAEEEIQDKWIELEIAKDTLLGQLTLPEVEEDDEFTDEE